jgi:hypothetical protein
MGLVIILSSWLSMDGVGNCCSANDTYFDLKCHAGILRATRKKISKFQCPSPQFWITMREPKEIEGEYL